MDLEEKKKYIKQASIEDHLQEDPPVYGQNFFILSYVLPSELNEIEFPLFKMRGAFKSQEDCQKRIEALKKVDNMFNLYVCEVGKFGSLLPEEELRKNDEIDFEYREAMLNNMVKSYKENKQKIDENFEERKNFLKNLAQQEGSKEGQAKLAGQKENPVSVKTRIETMNTHMEDLTNRMKEVQEIIDLSNEQLENDYTKEEISKAEEEYKQQYKENFSLK